MLLIKLRPARIGSRACVLLLMSIRFKFVLILCVAVAAGALAGFVWNLSVGLGFVLALLAGVGLASLPASKMEATDSSSPVHDAIKNRKEVKNAFDAHADTLLEAIMNGLREGILVVDEEMRVIASNRAARRIFSGVVGEIERARLSELTRNPVIHSAFTASLSGNEQAETKVAMQGAGGPTYDLRVAPL